MARIRYAKSHSDLFGPDFRYIEQHAF